MFLLLFFFLALGAFAKVGPFHSFGIVSIPVLTGKRKRKELMEKFPSKFQYDLPLPFPLSLTYNFQVSSVLPQFIQTPYSCVSEMRSLKTEQPNQTKPRREGQPLMHAFTPSLGRHRLCSALLACPWVHPSPDEMLPAARSSCMYSLVSPARDIKRLPCHHHHPS